MKKVMLTSVVKNILPAVGTRLKMMTTSRADNPTGTWKEAEIMDTTTYKLNSVVGLNF